MSTVKLAKVKTYVMFVLTRESEKTNQWAVVSTERDDLLGTIGWFGRWRQYTFSPATSTTYSSGCLDDISNFLQAKNAEHRRLKFSA